jgi:hypothetical protein
MYRIAIPNSGSHCKGRSEWGFSQTQASHDTLIATLGSVSAVPPSYYLPASCEYSAEYLLHPRRTSLYFATEQFVKSYARCNRHKTANRKAKCPMARYHARVPMERVHLDLLGLLPESASDNTNILVVVDQFTKWMECTKTNISLFQHNFFAALLLIKSFSSNGLWTARGTEVPIPGTSEFHLPNSLLPKTHH